MCLKCLAVGSSSCDHLNAGFNTLHFQDILAEALDVVAEEETAADDDAVGMSHTVEGMQAGIVVGCAEVFDDDASAISARRSRAGSCDVSKVSDGNPGLDIPFVLAAAGEAAVSGIVRQAIADSVQPLQDDFAYYINDGVYGAFNNLLFDHATVRPRKLRHALSSRHQIVEVVHGEGNDALRTLEVVDEADEEEQQDETLYPSTVFGPTCDSMDVLSRGKTCMYFMIFTEQIVSHLSTHLCSRCLATQDECWRLDVFPEHGCVHLSCGKYL
jgi:hypothetical protein